MGAGAIALVLICLSRGDAEQPSVTSRIVSAANSFLGTLDQRQRQSALYAFDDQDQRKRWSNFPVAMVPRDGMSMGERNATQRAAAMSLLASALSPAGFEKVQQIMEADEINKTRDRVVIGEGPGGAEAEAPRVTEVLRPGMQDLPSAPEAGAAAPATARCSGKISTTFPSSERLRKRTRGCCSLEGAISR
jgi:hypothetical protein